MRGRGAGADSCFPRTRSPLPGVGLPGGPASPFLPPIPPPTPPLRNPGPGVGAGSGVPQAAAPAARSPGPCLGPAGARRGHPASSRPLPSSWAPSASLGRRPPPCSQVRAGAAGARAGLGQVNGEDGLPPLPFFLLSFFFFFSPRGLYFIALWGAQGNANQFLARVGSDSNVTQCRLIGP